MDDFENVIKRDPQAELKITDMFYKYNSLPYNYQSKIGYDFLIQNVILKEIMNIRGSTITEIDIELKKKSSRKKHLESIKLFKYFLILKMKLIVCSENIFYNPKLCEMNIIVNDTIRKHNRKYGDNQCREIEVKSNVNL